jgi:hypothetical protein
MKVIQCFLKYGNQCTTRWVCSKKAKLGEKLLAMDMSGDTIREWYIEIVYSNFEIEEKFVYHAIK